MKFLNLFKNNILIIFLAIFVGFLMIAPQLIYEFKLGDSYKGITRVVNDDELYYLARGNDIVGGHSLLGNPYIYELKNKPTIQFFIPDYLLAKPLQLFGISISDGFFFYDILLAIILTILTYVCFYLLTNIRTWSLMGTTILIPGLFLLTFNRPVSPQFNFIFWLAQFIFILLYLKNREPKYFWLSVLNLGLLFYVYTYFWTFYYVVFGLAIAGFYFFGFKELSKKLFLMSLSAIAIGGYYFFNMINSANLPEYGETLTRLGMITSHWPSGLNIVLAALILSTIFLYLFWKKKLPIEPVEILMFSGIIGSAIVVNQHLITGKNLEFSSHYLLPAYYWFILALTYIFSKIVKNDLLKKLLLAAAVIFTLANIVAYLNKFLTIDAGEIYQQQYSSVLDWLNRNTNKDDVVFANDDLSNFIAAYTHDNVFYARNANLHFMTDAEVFDRFIINNYFANFSGEFVRNNGRAIFGVRFIDSCNHIKQVNKLKNVLGLAPQQADCLPDYSVDRILNRAKELQLQDFRDLLKKYRVDYVAWDFNKNPDWGLYKFDFFKKEFEYGGISIFRII